jgi:hypothetical protein
MKIPANYPIRALSVFSVMFLTGCEMDDNTHDAIQRSGSYSGPSSSSGAGMAPITHGYDGTEAPTYRGPNDSSAAGQLRTIERTKSWGGN